METPQLSLYFPALAAAFVVCFVFGFLWYGPLLGRMWAREMGMDFSKKPDPGVMKRAMLLQIVGLCLTLYVIGHSVQVWRPSVWGVGADEPSWLYGVMAGFFTWIGFYVPMQFGKIAWENRSWKLFAINTVYDLINLQLMANILASWRS